jgi:glycosyltransferase involved in cell wall biosynthesis
MIEDMGLNDAVSFIDYIDNADMPYVLSSADILVSTSLSDAGIAGSTAEAMSCEISVVITDSGENDRWVDHGKNGYLVQVSEPEELAKCIITLLENEDLRTNMGKEARKTILKQNDYFAEMKKMQNLYQSLIS